MAYRGIEHGDMTFQEKLSSFSWFFLLLIFFVAAVGFMCLYSAAGGDMSPWAGKHLARFSLGVVGLFIVSMIDIRIWMKLAYPVFGAIVLLLVYVDIKGHIGMGAQRWINLGFMQLQPSEVMKVAAVLALARFFHAATEDDMSNPRFLAIPAAVMLIPVGLIALQPDLTTAIIVAAVGVYMFFMAGVNYWIFIGAGGAVIVGAPIAWLFFMHDYQKQRVLTFLNPESDPLRAGYQIIQSKIAVGSGGVSGKGFLQGSQSHLNFLPEKQTDFIFTLFAEEWGLIGGLALLGLLALVVAYGHIIALRCQNQFGRLLASGVVINFSLYIFINVAMVMGLIPVAGVPLPMISHGGTAMLSVLFGFGLLMSAYVHRDIRFTRRGLEMA